MFLVRAYSSGTPDGRLLALLTNFKLAKRYPGTSTLLVRKAGVYPSGARKGRLLALLTNIIQT